MNKKEVIHNVILVIVVWIVFSFAASMIKVSPRFDNCGKRYPIDYVLMTNLFCEIKDHE